ncbi:hypothetical protein FSP39_000164 [Pinctada imbricata]|uniref:RNA 3'-terminal phosphate cyclase n=1 Tax=Pinctada imbricata TaxID=66713 RepID=A0AA88XNV8_PINIB|nr:hypothetical protein FSP39_000164 [Pinctada imbricata]
MRMRLYKGIREIDSFAMRKQTENVSNTQEFLFHNGGQILRNCATLSCLLNKPIRVSKIRAGRSNPGLRPQHLTGLQLIRDICNGKLEGGVVSSSEITFIPGKVKAGSYTGDTKTAGSICLLMQAALPCFIYADGEVTLRLLGGTNADMAPQIDYALMVFRPFAAKFGMNFTGSILRRGFYPKGGGEVQVKVFPSKCLNAVDATDRGQLTRVTGQAFVAGVLPIKVARAMSHSAQDVVRNLYPDASMHIDVKQETSASAFGTGTGITIVGETSTGCILAGSGLGKRGVPAEKVGEDAGEMLLNSLDHGGCVDDFLQDQIIILMALAKGKSRVLCGPMSLHTQTAIHVAQLMTEAKFEVKELSKTSTLIECEGIGLVNPYL